MLPIIGAMVAGAILMGRTKPKTRASKKALLGSRSGLTYEVEDFEQAGFIVVRGSDAGGPGEATLMRASAKTPGARGFLWVCGRGSPSLLRSIALDLSQQSPKPKQTASDSHTESGFG